MYIYHVTTGKRKLASVAILILGEKIDFEVKNTTREKEITHYDKGFIYQEEIIKQF